MTLLRKCTTKMYYTTPFPPRAPLFSRHQRRFRQKGRRIMYHHLRFGSIAYHQCPGLPIGPAEPLASMHDMKIWAWLATAQLLCELLLCLIGVVGGEVS